MESSDRKAQMDVVLVGVVGEVDRTPSVEVSRAADLVGANN
jgi:hypothetical protein